MSPMLPKSRNLDNTEVEPVSSPPVTGISSTAPGCSIETGAIWVGVAVGIDSAGAWVSMVGTAVGGTTAVGWVVGMVRKAMLILPTVFDLVLPALSSQVPVAAWFVPSDERVTEMGVSIVPERVSEQVQVTVTGE